MSGSLCKPYPPQGPPLFLASPLAGQSSSGAGHGAASGSRAGCRLLPQGPHTQSPLAPCSPVSGTRRGRSGPQLGLQQAGLCALRPLVLCFAPWLWCEDGAGRPLRGERSRGHHSRYHLGRAGQEPGPARCAAGSRGAAPGSWRGHFVLPQGGWAWAWLWEGGGDGGSRDHEELGQCMAHQQSCGGKLSHSFTAPQAWAGGWGWGRSALLPAPQHEPSSQLCGEGSWQPACLL